MWEEYYFKNPWWWGGLHMKWAMDKQTLNLAHMNNRLATQVKAFDMFDRMLMITKSITCACQIFKSYE